MYPGDDPRIPNTETTHVSSDVIVTHLQSAHLHAVFMEIFSVGQQAISENDLGADTALFIRLTGTLGTDKLIVHCDYLAMDDALTEGTPGEYNIMRDPSLAWPSI